MGMQRVEVRIREALPQSTILESPLQGLAHRRVARGKTPAPKGAIHAPFFGTAEAVP